MQRRSSSLFVQRTLLRRSPLATPSSALFQQYLPLSTASSGTLPWDRVRNVGILAHIDAGKTTTTEHMLYLCGRTKSVGRVDNGDTVMDFLPQEKERGITISAAAISAQWKDHLINIIDTPGHVDFTMEVEVSTRILDGCVLIVDAVSGVQCQTKTVWRKIASRSLPAIAFINKLDRDGADAHAAVNSIRQELIGTNPVLLQYPIMSDDKDHIGKFEGYIDLLSKQYFHWPLNGSPSTTSSTNTGSHSSIPPNIELINETHKYYELLQQGRNELFDSLSAVDDDFLTICLDGDYDNITIAQILPSLRRATIKRQIHPVFTGVALRGKGVNALLDGIIGFLPSPADLPPVKLMNKKSDSARETLIMRNSNSNYPTTNTPTTTKSTKSNRNAIVEKEKHDKFCALAFKVVHDNMRGNLVYTRVFSGTLNAKQTVYNATTGKSERIQQILSIAGNDFLPMPGDKVTAGSVCCLTGLKGIKSGDTLLEDYDNNLKDFILPGMNIPKPVFSLAIEPSTSSQQKALDEALKILSLEDPSLHIDNDNESGQTILKGLGELHLEIILDKLKRQHKQDVYTGKAYIGYRETIHESINNWNAVYDRMVEGGAGSNNTGSSSGNNVTSKRLFAQFQLDFISKPTTVDSIANDDDSDDDDSTGSSSGLSPRDATFVISDEVKQSLTGDEYTSLVDTLINALQRGPRGYPVVDMTVVVKSVTKEPQATTPGAIRACISTAISQILSSTSSSQQLLEPLMNMEIEIPDQYVGDVVNELTSKRRAQEVEIRNIACMSTSSQSSGAPSSGSIVIAKVPLQTILGYATTLRSMTHGEGSFTAEYHSHIPVSLHDASL